VFTALAVIGGIALAAVVLLIAAVALKLGGPLARGLFFDRSSTNDRTSLPRDYEVPRYLEPSSGKVDTSVRWPGWDGWYFFVIPDDKSLPTKMVRASIMTGLYGLQGIDDYEKLLLRLSSFDAVEHLVLIPTEITTPDRNERTNYLSHRYLPKRSDLSIKRDVLDVCVTGTKIAPDQGREPYGRIRGSWPDYQFDFLNPEAEIAVSLESKMHNIVWWADIPGVFTYFAAFGRFEGTITYRRGTRKNDPQVLMHQEEVYRFEGNGCFEHGCARKPFDFDSLWFPVRALGNLVPSLRAVRYQYELFVGDQNFHGGFMFVRAFVINLRDRGGFYLNGAYHRIKSVKIEYTTDEDEEVVTCRGNRSATFHKQWKVRAATDDGILEYTGTREWPPASVAANMIYYNFSYVGTYKGSAISGRGYGEYLSL
jgi:hypothetical protein